MPLIHRPFRRIGIVNRGEAAVRLIRAAHAWARRHREPLEVVALYTTPDRDAVFVRDADAAVPLGEPMVAAPDGQRSAYLDIPRVLRLLTAAGCDAVWPGWGFLSERPEFADACAAAGLVFIGPSGSTMRVLGDKIAGKRLAMAHGVPVTPWSEGPVLDAADALAHAERIGFPVLLKAAAGGGGRGIRLCRSADEVAPAFHSAAHESRAAFGDPTLLVEAFAPEARHVEVQILADAHGHIHAVGTRDCSMQRRHQKVLEEAPAPGLGALDARLREASIAIARASRYVNAGTAEFLVLPDRSAFYFLEMNTRLQVEHPVTEAVTGLDLVGLQIDIARGLPLPEALPPTRGHALEARLNAEDPDAGFRPSAGRLLRFDLATGPGVRIDSGFLTDDTIPGEFDSMLAKVVASGPTREDALARLEDALIRSTVAIEGGASNRTLLLELLGHDDFRAGPVTTRWLDRHLTLRPAARERRHLDAATIAAGIGEYGRARALEVEELVRAAHRGVPQNVAPTEPRALRFAADEAAISLTVAAIGPGRFGVECGGVTSEVGYLPVGPSTAQLTLRGRRLTVTQVATPTALYLEVDAVAHTLTRSIDGRVLAPVPAAVTEVHVREGDPVRKGQRLLTLEVMKMEVAVTAPTDGRLGRILVATAARVTAGQALAVIEAADAAVAEGAPSAGLVFTPDAAVDETTRTGEILLGAILGYDHPPARVASTLTLVAGGRVTLSRRVLTRLLDAYISHERLFDTHVTGPAAAAIDLLARHLRRRDAAGDHPAGLPEAFRLRLAAALAWHDVHSLKAAPRHDDALLRILQAHGALEMRDEILRTALTAALTAELPEVAITDRDTLRDRLEAFAALVVRRDQGLAESAYAALYQLCDRPRQLEETRRLSPAARGLLDALSAPACPPEDRPRLEAELDALPHGALLSLLRAPVEPPEATAEWRLLDLLTLRLHPEARRIGLDLPLPAGARLFELPEGLLLGVRTAAESLLPDLRGASAALVGGGPVEIEAFVPEPGAAFIAELETQVAAALDTLPPCVQRVSVNWGSAELGRLSRTFMRTPGDGGQTSRFNEIPFHRDFHPARIERTEVARFDAFDLRRLPAPGEIFLAVARSKSDPTDERMVAVVEVERFDPVRDPKTGALQRVPSFERVYMTALHAMRQAHRTLARAPRPFWNRLIVFIRPPLTISLDEIRHITRRLSPATSGLGLEKMIVHGTLHEPGGSEQRPIQIEWTNPTGHGATLKILAPTFTPVSRLQADERRVVEARRKSLFYPYELVRVLSHTADDGPLPRGSFTELELGDDGALHPTGRPHGKNKAHVVVGLVTSHFPPHDDGLERVLIVGDPTRGMGALAEPECRRILGAFELASRRGLAVEWVAVSSGARIALDSGTENLDWTARVLAAIVRFTQAGGTVNIIVDAINVGAQSYWNAEATMLMHCRGTLIMTPHGAMLLTGKKALEYAGSVAAEDNLGIGGHARVMGPNGQAQYFASDLIAAYRLLFRHLALTAVAPGEARPRRLRSADPPHRDVGRSPYADEASRTNGSLPEPYNTIGEIFDETLNPGRKRPFAIRPVMRAVLDADVAPLERWAGWQGAESAVVWEASLGGEPICCVGIESRPIPRRGETPTDGPEQFTSGTLFPLSSKKVARALNAVSGQRPVVFLANLSGFDGSPDSLRHLQLEYGAEIGRAVVNFQGPLVFCVVARYHGGAYVVFSRTLNPGLDALALEGSFASVIGGGPAAAVVFPGLVRKRAGADPAVAAARRGIEAAHPAARANAIADHERVLREVIAREQAAVAREFDAVHSVDRALQVGSLSAVIGVPALRGELVRRVSRDEDGA